MYVLPNLASGRSFQVTFLTMCDGGRAAASAASRAGHAARCCSEGCQSMALMRCVRPTMPQRSRPSCSAAMVSLDAGCGAAGGSCADAAAARALAAAGGGGGGAAAPFCGACCALLPPPLLLLLPEAEAARLRGACFGGSAGAACRLLLRPDGLPPRACRGCCA